VIGIPAVMEEAEVLSKGRIFSKKDAGDREFMGKVMVKEEPCWAKDVDEYIEITNQLLMKRGRLLKGAYGIHKKYNVPLFLWAVHT